MQDTTLILLIAITFLIAGFVKGVTGLGLPAVSLALLTAILGLPQAMALMLAPSFVTNAWQAAAGGHAKALAIRLWPFLLLAASTVWLGAAALNRVDVKLLSALLGALLAAYAVWALAGARFALPDGCERWAGPLAGSLNGILTGMTGSFVMPGVPYLQALGLPRDHLIQAMGMLFTASTAALALALQSKHLLTVELGSASILAVVPALAGMVLGQRVRHVIPEQIFRRVFLLALLALGAYIIVRSLTV